ncbi:MAG: glycosyltransferase family 4 protein [Acidobacteriota bacterium]|jgi:glycosyltransferase involved in cell wall biosynthesis
MRILHVADRLTDRGGACTWMLGVIAGLVEAGHDARLVVGAVDPGLSAPCPVDVRPGLEARTGAWINLDSLVRSFGPEVIHVHNVVNPAVLEWAAGRPNALLTIQDHRSFCPARGKWTLGGEECRLAMGRETCAPCFEDEAYFREVLALTERRLAAVRAMEAVTVLSRYMREELVRVGVPTKRIRVIPPFVHDLDRAAAPDGPPCVLFVGRLAAAKGVLEAVEAWRWSRVDLPLAVAGSGPLREELLSQAKASSGPPIEVLGWVGRQRLSSVYRRARALVLPSRWQEPFGIAGIEAFSFGVPVAAWESGGVSEWHPGIGLVPWGDVDALARAIAEAVNRRIVLPPSFPRDETIGRLLALYGRIA